MAMATPPPKARTATPQTAMWWKKVKPARMKASAIITDWVTRSRRRLLTRSAMTPPKRVTKRNGICPANPTTPSQKAELVRVRTSQPWATFCIQLPTLEVKLPAQKRRKLGLRRARMTCGNSVVSGSGRACTIADGSSEAAARFSSLSLGRLGRGGSEASLV